MSDTTADTDELVIVLNPRSGSADHVDAVEKRAAIRGYDVRETTHEGHALELARIAAQDGRQQVVAAGGDGTLNEVIRRSVVIPQNKNHHLSPLLRKLCKLGASVFVKGNLCLDRKTGPVT